jgi:hypothetical protein
MRNSIKRIYKILNKQEINVFTHPFLRHGNHTHTPPLTNNYSPITKIYESRKYESYAKSLASTKQQG